MKRRGFTIIELIIIIAVMGVLLTLGAVNLRGSQAKARDSERETDVKSLSLHMDNFYRSGSDTLTAGGYPWTELIDDGEDSIRTALQDVSSDILRAPGIDPEDISLVSATNSTQTAEGVAPQPTVEQYVYQPITSSGDLCEISTDICRKYNLYYRTEVDDVVQMVTSKNQ